MPITTKFPRTMARLKKIQNNRQLARHDDRRAAIEEIYMAGIRKTMAHAKLEVLHNLHAGTGKQFSNSKPAFANAAPVAAAILFGIDAFRKMFGDQMADAGKEALTQSGQGLNAELGLGEYVPSLDVVHNYVVNRQNRLADVPDEIYDTVKSSLEDGLKAGETMDQLAARVKDTFGDIEAGRARTIARTETATAYGTGRMDAIKRSGLTMKSWLTGDDGHVRDSHTAAMDQGPIPLDDVFNNGLRYPGDPSGPPEEVINCRCVLQAEESEESNLD